MFINPKQAIAEGWITGLKDEAMQVQPNAIDFTLDHLFDISDNAFFLSEQEKQMRGGAKQSTVTYNDTEVFKLFPHESYDGLSSIHVKLPEGVAAELIIRSTLNRNGMFLTSGLYDSGFEGHIGFVIHNRSSGPAYLEKGVRVGQIKFIASDSAGVYAGGYNHAEGTDGDWRG
jgi:deoxycytidine triphosphate deaminase